MGFKKSDMTMIRVTKATRAKLQALRLVEREAVNDVILRLLAAHDKQNEAKTDVSDLPYKQR